MLISCVCATDSSRHRRCHQDSRQHTEPWPYTRYHHGPAAACSGEADLVEVARPTYGESNILIMLGGMYLEMAILRVIGVLLKRSGWTALLVQASVTSLGMADYIPTVAHLNRTRIYVCDVSRSATHLQGAHPEWADFGSCY